MSSSNLHGKIPGTHSVVIEGERVVPLMMVMKVKECSHCKKKIKSNTKIIAVGAPHHTLLHFNCWQYFDYATPYSHERPISITPGF